MATAIATESALSYLVTLHDLIEHLGGIAPSRIRIRPSPGTATEADLVEVNARKLGVHELIDGILVEKGMGLVESTLAGLILSMLRAFVIPPNLGIVTAADGMLRLFPGLVRVPDVAFVSWTRIPGGRYPIEAIGGFAPDLAVEVLGRSNTMAEMARKRLDYFGAGVRLVWEVDPRTRTVAVYEAPDRSFVLDGDQILEGGEVLPGFALPLSQIFGQLDRQVP